MGTFCADVCVIQPQKYSMNFASVIIMITYSDLVILGASMIQILFNNYVYYL